MGVPLRSGRFFSDTDKSDAPFVVIINDVLARQYFGVRTRLVSVICFDRTQNKDSTWRTIVGSRGVGEAERPRRGPQTRVLSRRIFKKRTNPARLVIRSAVEPKSLLETMRKALRSFDPSLVLYDVGTMEQVLSEDLGARALPVDAAGGLRSCGHGAGDAGCLQRDGLHDAAALPRKSAIRMALGAKALDVLSLVVRQGMGPVVLGVVLGLGGALGLTHSWQSLLFETAPTDPPTFVMVTGLLALVALTACLVPAREGDADPSRGGR
jgi:hypothetical protein